MQKVDVVTEACAACARRYGVEQQSSYTTSFCSRLITNGPRDCNGQMSLGMQSWHANSIGGKNRE